MSNNDASGPDDARSERTILPTVARPSAGPSKAVIVVAIMVAAAILFVVLDSRRRALTAPPTRVPASDLLREQMPPILYVPPALPAPAPVMASTQPAVPPLVMPSPPRAPDIRPEPNVVHVAASNQPLGPVTPPLPPRSSGGPAIVLDASAASGGNDDAASRSRDASGAPGGGGFSGTPIQSRAGRIADRSSTVPQGTIIPAVLETAINSS